MKTKLSFLKQLLFISILFCLINETTAQIIAPTNTGSIGRGNTPTGWTDTNTPDIVTLTSPNYSPWGCTPTNPPNGHTQWPVGLAGFNDEFIAAPITGLTAGTTYSFTCYLGNFYPAGAGSGSPNNGTNATINLTIDGVVVSSTVFNSGICEWKQATFTFTPTTSSVTLSQTVTAITGSLYFWWNMSVEADAVSAACGAGTTAPALTSTTLSNICLATTVDLTSITATNMPASTSLTWHTATPATTANLVTDATMATAGSTYHAAFYDATNDCYSDSGNGTTSVATSSVTCCAAGEDAPGF